LPHETSQAIEFHHSPQAQAPPNDTTLFVHLADQLCLQSDLGYGYAIGEGDAMTFAAAWCALAENFPRTARFTAEEYAVVIDSTLTAARDLADRVFGPIPVRG